jgi:transcriptional regulator GlxA family with amidase domain
LDDERVREALPMLKANRMTVAEIAERVGFKSYQAMASSFHRIYGMGPVAWRGISQ